MKSVDSSSLGLQMQLANLAISTVASAARMFQFRPTAHMKSWDTSKVSSQAFRRDQRLILETPGWRVLDFEGNPFTESELERWRESIFRGPLVIRDREYPKDLIVDDSGAPDAKLPVLAKVSTLVEVLRLGGFYKLVHQLWSHFTLTASRVNIDVTWSRDEVLVGILCFMCLRIHVHWLIAAVF